MARIKIPGTFRRNIFTREPEDLGFGTQLTGADERLINPDGSFNVERSGATGWTPYQAMLEMSWPKFFALIAIFFLLVNGFFASLYLLAGVESTHGVKSLGEQFAESFFFSVQTFTTVEYSEIRPVGLPGRIVATFNSLVELIGFAMVTGLFYARFAKPRAQFLFSSFALIAPYQGRWSFQFRIANKRKNQIINLKARMFMSWIEARGEDRVRRYAAMDLVREQVSLFPLNWTIVHAIRKGSPLFGRTEKDLEQIGAEFLILIEGYDETYTQDVYANHSYTWKELKWGKRFKRMYYEGENGRTVLDLGLINEVEELKS